MLGEGYNAIGISLYGRTHRPASAKENARSRRGRSQRHGSMVGEHGGRAWQGGMSGMGIGVGSDTGIIAATGVSIPGYVGRERSRGIWSSGRSRVYIEHRHTDPLPWVPLPILGAAVAPVMLPAIPPIAGYPHIAGGAPLPFASSH